MTNRGSLQYYFFLNLPTHFKNQKSQQIKEVKADQLTYIYRFENPANWLLLDLAKGRQTTENPQQDKDIKGKGQFRLSLGYVRFALIGLSKSNRKYRSM